MSAGVDGSYRRTGLLKFSCDRRVGKAGLLAGAVALIAGSASAATVSWNFGTTVGSTAASAVSSPSDFASTPSLSSTQVANYGTTPLFGNTDTQSSGYVGASGGMYAQGTGTYSNSNTTNLGFKFDFTPAAGKQISFTGVQFAIRSNGAPFAPDYIYVYSSVDNYRFNGASTANPPRGSWIQYTGNVIPAFNNFTSTGPVSLLLSTWWSSAFSFSTQSVPNFYLDDVQFTYNASNVAVPEPTSLGLVGTLTTLLRRRQR